MLQGEHWRNVENPFLDDSVTADATHMFSFEGKTASQSNTTLPP